MAEILLASGFTIGTIIELFCAIKDRYDAMKDNKEAVGKLVSRVLIMSEPVKEMKANKRPYPSDAKKALEFLQTTLQEVRDIAHGLDYLYYRGVTHKDIKAENIMIADNPFPLCAKVGDFGISKQGN